MNLQHLILRVQFQIIKLHAVIAKIREVRQVQLVQIYVSKSNHLCRVRINAIINYLHPAH